MVNKEILNYLSEGEKRGFEISLLKGKLLGAGFDKKIVDGAIAEMVGAKKTETKKPENVGKAEIKKSQSEERVSVDWSAKLGFFRKIWTSFAHPTELFNAIKGEGIGGALKYYYLIIILPFILLALGVWFFSGLLAKSLVFGSAAIEGVFFSSIWINIGVLAGWFFVVLPILLFVFAGVLHGVVKLLKGQGRFGDTYGVVVYSLTPFILFMWVPPLAILFSIWSLVLEIFGLSVNHQISKGRAFLALFVYFIVIGGIMSGIFGLVWYFYLRDLVPVA